MGTVYLLTITYYLLLKKTALLYKTVQQGDVVIYGEEECKKSQFLRIPTSDLFPTSDLAPKAHSALAEVTLCMI